MVSTSSLKRSASHTAFTLIELFVTTAITPILAGR